MHIHRLFKKIYKYIFSITNTIYYKTKGKRTYKGEGVLVKGFKKGIKVFITKL